MYPWQCITLVLTWCTIANVLSQDERVTATKCCPSGFGLLPNHSCVPFDTGPFIPPMFVGEDSQTQVDVEVVGDENWDPACSSTQVLKQVILGNDSYLYSIGQEVLLYWWPPDTHHWVLEDSFCVAMAADNSALAGKSPYMVEFCYEDRVLQWREDAFACQNATCITKCCPEGYIFNATCQLPHEDIGWSPVFHSVEDHSVITNEPADLHIVYGIPECPVSLIYDDFTLLETGKIEVPGYASDIPNSRYCLEAFAEETGGAVDKLVLCHDDEGGDSCFWRHIIVDTVFMSISCVFLATTWIIYVCVAELRTNTHGRCMISFITALLIAFITILVNRNHRETFSAFGCSLTAVLSHMSILATFFWLNVLSYHIWNCLRSGRKRDEKRVFLVYSIYAWGCPFLVGLVGVVLDATKADVMRPDFLPPHCWFKDRTTKWVYQYGFMLVLLLINFTFFLSSVFIVMKRLRQIQDMQHHSVSLWLYMKLFIIMGITWLTEMITWLLEENSCKTWVAVLDGITALHGVYIFLVTVCLRRDLRIFRRCCDKTKYDVDGNTLVCTRDNAVELLDGQTKLVSS